MTRHTKFRIGPDTDSDGALQLFSAVLGEIVGKDHREQKRPKGCSAYLEMVSNESGQLDRGHLMLRRASHIGPKCAQKSENQDATFALRCGSNFIFALSDGVGSSLGARLAAAVVVVEFCQYLREWLQPSPLVSCSAPFKHGKPFEVQPGLLLKWKTLQQPSIEDLRTGIEDKNNPTNWPDSLTKELKSLRGGQFFHALRYCLDHASSFRISSGSEICRILAGIAQTMLTLDEDLRRRNINLAAQYLHELRQLPVDRRQAIIDAARFAQASLDVVLDELIRNPTSPEFTAVRGTIPHLNALRFLENTKNPERPYGPALATTLIGGLVGPSTGGNRVEASILAIGDGIVERIDRQGHAYPIVAMDQMVKMISTVVSPGPISRAALQRQLSLHQVEIDVGESLIVSSDGLARGHNQSVSRKLSATLGAEFSGLPFLTTTETLHDVLERAAGEADKLFLNNQQISLFQDNLSLIVIQNKNGLAERASDGTT